ncbi:PrgI family protein [Candidatus Uhrbacteria bacterium]|nr:PrgI family protein [Candidatus Uhrbacteria bacterium]
MPQFIDAEDKLLPGVSMRSFVILMVTMFIEMILYATIGFNTILFLVIAIPVLVLGVAFSYLKVNGAPLHFFVLNMVQTTKRPRRRVWDRRYTNMELRDLMKAAPAPPELPPPSKGPLSSSRLQELSLVVNTGGVYKPDEEA